MKERKARLVVLLAGFWLLAGMNILADVIRLRDGSVLRGKVVSYREKKFTIVVRIAGVDSQYVVPVEDIDSVEFGDGEERSGAGTDRSEGGGAEPLRPRVGATRPVPPAASTTRVGPSDKQEARDTAARRTPAPPTERDLAGVGDTGTVIIEKKVTVAGAADWTSTEIRVQRGQRIVINASGEVDLGENQRSGPGGRREINDPRKPLPSEPTGGLIAVVGDDNDEFIFVGGSTEFPAPHNGIIFLLINERSLQDNSGSFVARVRILSNR